MGGSVITNKETPYTFKRQRTRRLIKEVASSIQEGLIIVHGGGSFGHPGAEEYHINNDEPRNVAEAASNVQNDMRLLNTRVLELMIEEGLYPISLPGGLVTYYENKELVQIDEDIFKRYLNIGTVPVTFGDVALDKSNKITICSGDDLMLALGKMADRAIFVSDVDGIYKNGNLVKEFSKSSIPLTQDDLPSQKDSIDVTGGMNRKIKSMLKLSKYCRTFLVNGRKKGRLSRLIDGNKVTCTEVI